MCISPQVSFSLSGSLLLGGAYCIRKAVRNDRAFIPLAITPAIFGIQQFCEGWVWTGLQWGNQRVVNVASLGYLMFALCFWPIWIPFTTLQIERSRRTKWFMRAMTALGGVMALTLMLPLIIHPAWFEVEVFHHSLHYSITSSPVFGFLPDPYWEPLYFLVVATPLFVSSQRKFINAGIAAVLTAAATHIFFHHTFATVWCFIAAALSLYLCVFFSKLTPRSGAAPALGVAGSART